ncbi:signal peptidase I [Longicatena caecimuris]|uniref:signal peptidase I n=1 Tax=Longicatena caecimuris TaxID=1796635 RepID=UPI001D08746F|nr:signal peptidase I [Longicatena caecimuris]MCB7330070.1 signal peptidase I [Longicatena caecimuris]MCB7338547.1 signal peptidase I [Longicatena caecimuris]
MHKSVNSKHRQERDETLGRVIGSNLLSLLKIFLACFVLVYLTINFAVRPIHVSGQSMFPTIEEGDFALSNAFSAKFQEIERGDIVIAYENKQMHRMIIKRVIGLPGDRISCKDDKVYVNDKALDEPYLDNEWANAIRDTVDAFTEDFTEVCLQEDEYWLMGDNRINSRDSRDFGSFKRSQIKGKDALVIFPFHKIHIPK